MKSIKFENDCGDTIEIKRGKKGVINVRHSDVHPKKFGQDHEFAERRKPPEFAAAAAKRGIDTKDPKLGAALEAFGAGYLVLHFKTYILNAAEGAMIREAVKKLEGRAPMAPAWI